MTTFAALIVKIAESIRQVCGEQAETFRYGGDEFIIVLTEATQTDTLRIAERIRSRVEKTKIKSPAGDFIPLSLSIGAAMFNGHPDYERLIQIADEALYTAKRRGRNCVELWKPAS